MIALDTNDRMTDNYENVNHLVLNFYPDGYSIAVKLNEFPVFTSETILETAKIPYEETGLLDYIANEELPPLLVEMIDNSPKLSQYKIWRNGCLIIEVRDKIESTIIEESKNSDNNDNNNHNQFYKRSQSAAKGSHYAQTNLSQTSHWFQNLGNHDHHNGLHHNGIDLDDEQSTKLSDDNQPFKKGNYFVVLKPTNLSMLYDVLNLTSSKCWSAQQRLQLESQIVLHNSPSLFLEPDPSRLTPESPDQPLHEDNENHDNQLLESCRWTSTDHAINPSNACSNKCSKLNGNGNHHQRKLSQKTRLKSIYLNREIHVSHLKTNGNGNKNSNNTASSNLHPKMNNIYHNPSNNQRSDATETLPPELTLQQFLATKRSIKKKSFPIGQFPRFHRYLKEHK
jgi:hypothetical protein